MVYKQRYKSNIYANTKPQGHKYRGVIKEHNHFVNKIPKNPKGYKELITKEEKDCIMTSNILLLPSNEQLTPTIEVLSDFGYIKIIVERGDELIEMNGNNVIISGRTEDIQNYFKRQGILAIGSGNVIMEDFQIIYQH